MKFTLPPDTPEGQKKAITASDKIITVGAGAGTGKTWVLSGRYVRLLAEDDEILPNDILTLTYTEAAAGDMKRRIAARIEHELMNTASDERRRAITDGLADSWISTIHSFAARLIRESGLSLDVDPKASVITTRQEQDFWDSIREASEFAKLSELARSYGDKTLNDIAKFLDHDEYFTAGIAKWKAGRLSIAARKTAELHASSGHTWEQMIAWSENNELVSMSRPLVKKILAEEWREVWDIWQNIPNLPEGRKTSEAVLELNGLLDRYRGQAPDDDTLMNFYLAIMTRDDIKVKGKALDALRESLGCSVPDWRKTRPGNILEVSKTLNAPLTPEEARMRMTIMKFCALCWGMWDMMKKRRGLLSFSDMILHAKKTIEEGGVKRKFRHILVDEFQDTDPLQFQMIKSLAESSGDTALFAVGDPKQSIYKFRHADPSLFAQTIRLADTRIDLDVSFRTRKSLLVKINSLFSSIWRGGLGKSSSMDGLTFEPLDPSSANDIRNSGTMPDFKIILARHNSKITQEARKSLAEDTASRIAGWVSDELTIWDKEAGIIRPVRYSDIAILSRGRSIYGVLEEALGKFGIKSIQDKSTDYFSRGEVNDIICLLRAAADINDDFSVMGWLMSPFSGVSEDEALRCFMILDKDTRPAEMLRQNFPEAYSRLEYYALAGEYEGPEGLLSIFDRDRRWLGCYRPDDRLRVLRNLRHSLKIAHEFQQGGSSSLTACAEWLTSALRNEVSIEEPAWHDKDENAVRLGVVHSAKGLEYPVTIIFETRVKAASVTEALRPSKELGIVFSSMPDEITGGREFKPVLSKWESLLSTQGDEEEETRLFYVAATRAQDSLIFCGLINDSDNKPYSGTWTKLLLENCDVKYEVINGTPKARGQAYHDEEKAKIRAEVVRNERALRQISASSFALYEWCPFAWRRRYRQGINLEWELPHRESDEGYHAGGANLGSLAHWVLSRWPGQEIYTLLNDRATLALLPGYLRATWRDRKAKAELETWLEDFTHTELAQTLKAHHEDLRHEYHFRVKLNEAVSMAGAIDAFFGNNITDFKITGIDDTPPGLYDSQLEFYALVLHELAGYETVNTSTVFLREGRVSEGLCSDFDGIKERVISASEICAREPFEAKREHCGLCPFRKGCAKYAG